MTLSSAEPKKHRNRLSEAFHYLSKIYPPRHSSNKSVVSPGKSKNSRCSFSCNSDDNDTGESDPSRSTCSNNGQTTAPHCREGQNQKHERHRDDHHSDGKPKVRLPLWTPPECDMCQSGENERPTVIRMEEGAELFSQPYLGVKDQEENGPNDGLNDGLHNMNNRVTVSVETPEGRVFDDIAGASTASPTSSEKLSHAYQELVDALAANADPFVPSSPDIHDPCSPPDLANPVEQLPMPCRRASNQSVLSEKSTSTVQRYPSRHCSPPLMNNIDSILQNFDFQNSGDDNKDKEPSDEKPESEEKQRDEEEDAPVLFSLTPQSAEKRPSGNDSHQQQHLANASSSSNDRSFLKSKSGSQPLSGSSKSWGCFSRSRKSQPSSASLSHKILFTSGDERRDLLRMKSMTSLKASAKAFGLNIPGVNEFRPPEVPGMSVSDADVRGIARRLLTLTPESSGKPSSGETSDTTALAKGGGHTLRGRLRSVRSSLQVKRRPKMKKTLRRIKTMTNISVQFPPHSLKGKSLEELVRLGGDGSLRLPLHYAPAPLRLPAGIAACCVFLTRYGKSGPNPSSLSWHECNYVVLISNLKDCGHRGCFRRWVMRALSQKSIAISRVRFLSPVQIAKMTRWLRPERSSFHWSP